VTGRRARHVCANPGCSKKFRPVRADAEYCSNACKQAHYRARAKAKAAAEALFRVKQNTLDFEAHQRTAVDLRSKVRGIEVIATNTGVLVAETAPGARALAASLRVRLVSRRTFRRCCVGQLPALIVTRRKNVQSARSDRIGISVTARRSGVFSSPRGRRYTRLRISRMSLRRRLKAGMALLRSPTGTASFTKPSLTRLCRLILKASLCTPTAFRWIPLSRMSSTRGMVTFNPQAASRRSPIGWTPSGRTVLRLIRT